MLRASLDDLDGALDALLAIEVKPLDRPSRAAVLLRIERARTRLEAAALGVIRAFDDDGDYLHDHAYGTANWITAQTGTARAHAGSRVHLARHLRWMPLAEEALRNGRITEAHTRVLARCITPRTREAFADSEAMLVGHAERLSADDLAEVVTLWLHYADEDGATPKVEKPDTLSVSRTLDGRYKGTFDYGPTLGEELVAALNEKVTELLRRDKAIHEADPTDPLADQEPGERRARALAELVAQGSSAKARAARKPSLSVVVDHRTIAGEDAGADTICESNLGTVIPIPLAQLWSCDCDVERLIMSADGVPLEMGRSARTVRPHQRRALTARDRGCAVPGCDRPPSWTDAHHIIHWTNGGKTDIPNLVLLCRHHHRRIHAGHLEVEMENEKPVFTDDFGRRLRLPRDGLADERAA